MTSTPFTAEFDDIVKKTLTERHVPGIALSVVHGEKSWSKGYGLAQQPSTPFAVTQGYGLAQQPSTPYTPTTLSYGASTTKAFLCAAWAIYINSEENKARGKDKITFSTPLASIIRDDFVLSDSRVTQEITIEDALSHRTGLPAHDPSYGRDGVKTPKDVTRNLRHLPLATPLRSKFEYCNTMYVAASHALEVVTSRSLAENLREWIWQPLDMDSTYASYDEAAATVEKNGAVLAEGTTWTSNEVLVKEKHMIIPEVSGAGYIISTADDYAKWMRCLLSSSSPLTEEIVKELWRPRTIRPLEEDDLGIDGIPTYALGWFVETYRGQMVMRHSGGLVGGGAGVVLLPKKKWGVSFFTNGHYGYLLMRSVVYWLVDEMLGVPDNERVYARMDAGVRTVYAKFNKQVSNAKSTLYPDAPAAPTVALTLPLSDYAGTYFNAGYGSLTFTVDHSEDTLTCKAYDRTWPLNYQLRHVNAEYWIATGWLTNSPLKTSRKAETSIGADGKVEAIGIAVEGALPDKLIWFDSA